METQRDDFGIAIRSAFLQKGVRQRFSLFALIIISAALLFVERFENKPLNIFRAFVNDGIYRGSYILSIPNKFFSHYTNIVANHFDVYEQNKILKNEKEALTKKAYEARFLRTENKKLKKILNSKSNTSLDLKTAKIILDKDSPFINSFIINQGTNSSIKKGMAVTDSIHLVGRVVEVNYFSSRILLLKDLNSKIPVVIEPSGEQAILSGTNDDEILLEFLPKDHKLEAGNLIFTSGKDGVFFPGIPVGKVKIANKEKVLANLLSDPNQLSIVNIIINKPSDNWGEN